jgi:hypothetical protein
MPQNMFSSPSKIVSAINLNNELNSKRSDQHKRRADSFGDNALISTSPGYTSVFDEQGEMLFADLVDEFSLMFETDNPRFDATKFALACYKKLANNNS